MLKSTERVKVRTCLKSRIDLMSNMQCDERLLEPTATFKPYRFAYDEHRAWPVTAGEPEHLLTWVFPINPQKQQLSKGVGYVHWCHVDGDGYKNGAAFLPQKGPQMWDHKQDRDF